MDLPQNEQDTNFPTSDDAHDFGLNFDSDDSTLLQSHTVPMTPTDQMVTPGSLSGDFVEVGSSSGSTQPTLNQAEPSSTQHIVMLAEDTACEGSDPPQQNEPNLPQQVPAISCVNPTMLQPTQAVSFPPTTVECETHISTHDPLEITGPSGLQPTQPLSPTTVVCEAQITAHDPMEIMGPSGGSNQQQSESSPTLSFLTVSVASPTFTLASPSPTSQQVYNSHAGSDHQIPDPSLSPPMTVSFNPQHNASHLSLGQQFPEESLNSVLQPNGSLQNVELRLSTAGNILQPSATQVNSNDKNQAESAFLNWQHSDLPAGNNQNFQNMGQTTLLFPPILSTPPAYFPAGEIALNYGGLSPYLSAEQGANPFLQNQTDTAQNDNLFSAQGTGSYNQFFSLQGLPVQNNMSSYICHNDQQGPHLQNACHGNPTQVDTMNGVESFMNQQQSPWLPNILNTSFNKPSTSLGLPVIPDQIQVNQVQADQNNLFAPQSYYPAYQGDPHAQSRTQQLDQFSATPGIYGPQFQSPTPFESSVIFRPQASTIPHYNQVQITCNVGSAQGHTSMLADLSMHSGPLQLFDHQQQSNHVSAISNVNTLQPELSIQSRIEELCNDPLNPVQATTNANGILLQNSISTDSSMHTRWFSDDQINLMSSPINFQPWNSATPDSSIPRPLEVEARGLQLNLSGGPSTGFNPGQLFPPQSQHSNMQINPECGGFGIGVSTSPLELVSSNNQLFEKQQELGAINSTAPQQASPQQASSSRRMKRKSTEQSNQKKKNKVNEAQHNAGQSSSLVHFENLRPEGNAVYDVKYQSLGMPLDPHLRLFNG